MKAAIRTSLMVCIALMSLRIFAQQKDWQSVAAGDPILQAMHATTIFYGMKKLGEASW